MTQKQLNQKKIIWNSVIILFSIIGLIVCIALLFPQTRMIVMDFAEQIMHKKASTYQSWMKALLSNATGGILFILFFDYCTLTNSGRVFVKNVVQEIKDCLSEIDFRSLYKPVLILSVIYLLGILTLIRANFLYEDDISISITGSREWYEGSRYLAFLLSYFVQPEINVTNISPIPQLLAVLILSCSSVLLVYILGKGKITIVGLLASIPLGLSPYYLECLSYSFTASYMALSLFACIVPFLFISRRKAFISISIISLLIMCLTYQVLLGVYPMIVLILYFQHWNSGEKTNKENLSFLLVTASVFCFAILLFYLFIMRPPYGNTDIMLPIPQLISGILNNIKNYSIEINHDFGIIWKICIVLVLLFFISKSMYHSIHKKSLSFFISLIVIGLCFILSYGIFLLFKNPLYFPRMMSGFGVFLAILCIYVVSDYKKIALFPVIALNWCLFVFAFSYGNALADQARYAEFRISILLHDLSNLYPSAGREDLSIQFKNSIDFAPTIINISKHYPIIEKLVPKRLSDTCWYYYYPLEHFNYMKFNVCNWQRQYHDYNTMDLPVVLDSYYHTIKSDGEHVLVILKH